MIHSLLTLLLVGNIMTLTPADMMIAKHADIIEQLIQCESSDRDITVKNDDGSPSYSYLQWKKSTWNYYVEKYDLFFGADGADLENLMHDRWANRLVASFILEEKNGWKNWYNCGLKIGLNK